MEALRPYIIDCWKMKMNDNDILKELKQKHIDLNKHGLGYDSFTYLHPPWNILLTRIYHIGKLNSSNIENLSD